MDRLDGKQKADGRRQKMGRYVAVLLLLISFFMIFSALERRYSWDADMTGEQLFTLSSATEKSLGRINRDVMIFTLYSPGNDNKYVSALLKKYAALNKHISLNNLDPSLSLEELEKQSGYMELSYGTVAVYSEETGLSRSISQEEMFFTDNGREYINAESKLTAAIEYVATGEQQRVYFMDAHRERDIKSLSGFISGLKLKNLEVAALDILESGPEQGSVVFSVSPRKDFSPEELELLRQYIEDGGTFMLLYDTAEYDPALGCVTELSPETPELNAFLETFGMVRQKGNLHDADSRKTGIRPTVIELELKPGYGVSPDKSMVMGECSPVMLFGSAEEMLVTSPTAYVPGSMNECAQSCVAARSRLGKGSVLYVSSSSLLTMSAGLSNDELLSAILNDAGASGSENIKPKPITAQPMSVGHEIVRIMLAVILLVLLPGGVLVAGARVIKKRLTNGLQK